MRRKRKSMAAICAVVVALVLAGCPDQAGDDEPGAAQGSVEAPAGQDNH